MEKKLPKGWLKLNFTDLLDIKGGNQPPKSQFINEPQEGYVRLLQIRDFGNKPVPTYVPIKQNQLECNEDDVLIARYGASIGRIVTGMKGTYNVALAKVISPEILPKNFIKWYLKSDIFQRPITSTQRTAQNGFNKEDLESVIFPLPPLPEQERIVAKLDKLFAQHEKIKKALDRIPQLLKAFRQQVLTQAVTGKLTEQWREGKELEEWDKRLVKEITTKLGSGSTPRGGSATYLSEGIPLVRSMNVVFGGLKLDGLAFINEVQAAALKNVEIHFEDILLNITGASIGRLCLADKSVIGGRVNQHVFIIRADKEIVNPKFLESYLRSNLVQCFIEAVKYGAGMEAISKTQIENLEICTPPIREQQEIVRRVESLFAKADVIEERYKILKEKIEHLPQAILHKAFKGELVPQLPTDGDAKDLLAEIMALKTEAKGKRNKT